MSDKTPKNKPLQNTPETIADFQEHLSRMQRVKARIHRFLQNKKLNTLQKKSE